MQAWVWAVILGFLLSQVSAFATTVYLHRGITHRGIRFHPGADFVFRALLWLTTGIIPKKWIAVHRKHHAFTDAEGDPHSPYLLGFWKVQLFNYNYYFKEIRNEETIKRYASDIPEDWFDRHVFNHNSVGLVLTTAALCIPLGLWGLLASALSMFLYVMISSTINGLCHWLGYKNFDNTACNVQPVAWISAGEGLHNNHHAFPACPKLSMRRGEWDPAWFSVKMMKKLGLCTPAKTISISEPVLHVTVAKRLAHKPTLVEAED
jgi:stearoyl-CoA desaturase (delta-9 desaturase)